MIRDLFAKTDGEKRDFQEIELEMLALNLDFEAARVPAAGSRLMVLSDKLREIAGGEEGDITGV
jgi:hypothetical protein